jgi:hypothetical protein
MATALKWGCSVAKTEQIMLMVRHIEAVFISEIKSHTGEVSHRLNFRMTSGKTIYVSFKGEHGWDYADEMQDAMLRAIVEEQQYIALPNNAIEVG